MGPVAGEGRLSPRLLLGAPELPVATLADCFAAACAAGDVASLVVPPSLAKEIAPLTQAKSVAVLTTGDPRNAARLDCDGIHIDALPLAYDQNAFLDLFLARWPVSSAAHASYFQRIVSGPAYEVGQAEPLHRSIAD